MLSMVLITVEGDITKDGSDPADPEKIAFNRAGRKKPVSASAETLMNTHAQARTDTHTAYTQTKTNTHTYRDLNLPPSLLLCLPRAFLCVSTHLGLHSSL